MPESIAKRALTIAVPIRSFAGGKERMSSSLSAHERGDLARRVSNNLIDAIGSFHVVVVTNDTEVGQWALRRDVEVIQPSSTGLNAAAGTALAWAARNHRTQLTIVHSDVPQPRSLTRICEHEGITIVPDHQRDGTNVLSLPVHLDFEFSYGVHSFARHVQQAAAIAKANRCSLRVIHHHELGLDLDTPTDLAHPLASSAVKDLTP